MDRTPIGRSVGELRACAEAHLLRYLDPDYQPPRAFHAYDGPGDDPDTITALDMLAPVLLSVRLTYSDVVPMFASAGPHRALRDAMQAVLADEKCRKADFFTVDLQDGNGPWSKVMAAFEASYKVRNLKAVAVSKVLHRKRPHLVPVFDRQLYRFYFGELPVRWRAHEALWPVLQDDLATHRVWLTDLARQHQPAGGVELTPLRAADIIIWEHQVAPTAYCATA